MVRGGNPHWRLIMGCVQQPRPGRDALRATLYRPAEDECDTRDVGTARKTGCKSLRCTITFWHVMPGVTRTWHIAGYCDAVKLARGGDAVTKADFPLRATPRPAHP
jgi:hypothetical protein